MAGADDGNPNTTLLGSEDISKKIKEMTRDPLPYFPNFFLAPLLFLGG